MGRGGEVKCEPEVTTRCILHDDSEAKIIGDHGLTQLNDVRMHEALPLCCHLHPVSTIHLSAQEHLQEEGSSASTFLCVQDSVTRSQASCDGRLLAKEAAAVHPALPERSWIRWSELSSKRAAFPKKYL